MKKPQLAFLLLMSLCASPVTAAQQETATITGSVKDQSGAIVPKATVTVTNTQTNISVKTEADDTGFYIVPSLRPGEYSVTVESAGFSKVVRSGVTLQVAQVARIDLTLQPGQLTESVEVVAATPLLDKRQVEDWETGTSRIRWIRLSSKRLCRYLPQ